VSIDSFYQVIGHAYVKHSVAAIGHYINVVLLAHYSYYTGDCFGTNVPRNDTIKNRLEFCSLVLWYCLEFRISCLIFSLCSPFPGKWGQVVLIPGNLVLVIPWTLVLVIARTLALVIPRTMRYIDKGKPPDIMEKGRNF
jgi:hypothetical protein